MASGQQSPLEHTNLVFIRKSRPKLRVGDIFSFKLLDGPYRFGRVVVVDGPDCPRPQANLVYIYEASADDLTALPLSDLTPDRLLIRPIWVNRQGWLRGYFVNVAHAEVSDTDLLKQHCFVRVLPSRNVYVDLHGNPLSHEIEPCGEWGVASHRVVDDEVSKALGHPLAPD